MTEPIPIPGAMQSLDDPRDFVFDEIKDNIYDVILNPGEDTPAEANSSQQDNPLARSSVYRDLFTGGIARKRFSNLSSKSITQRRNYH
jgi:hypothetical protein